MNRYPLQAAIHASPTLFALALTAPHCALRVVDGAAESVMHAVTMDGFVAAYDGRETLTGACGATDLKVVGLPLSDPAEVLPWPPRVAGLDPFSRCRDCWVATGKHRPRSERSRG